uniref:SHSP domain-containing protein n=1 Tax=Globodera rostochiensis TaxID=31243 RepID=A0A914GRJ7_GLORO
MALVSKWRSDWPSLWRDRFSRDLDDWPRDWPRPGELMERFRSRDFDRDHWWRDWPTDWPRMDAIVPRVSAYNGLKAWHWKATMPSDGHPHPSVSSGIPSASSAAPSRPSPRWKDPLVEEFPAEMRDGKNGSRRIWTRTEEEERKRSEWRENRWDAEEEGEEPFFSEEFYRAFPHLRGAGMAINGWTRRRGGPFDDKEFSSYLDRFDRNWRDDPFWRDLYPRWAEPIFKDGIDVKTNIVNDNSRFAVEIDTYQFRPEELQVKTMDDTLLIEGRHEDVRDRENYTKMYFVRKYLLPADVEPHSISSHIDSSGRLSVEAQKRWQAIEGERSIPIESGSRRYGSGYGSRSSSHSPRDRYYADSGRGSANDQYRVESRSNGAASGGAYLSPNPRSDGYRTEYEKRETDANGMRHEARREEFREEFRRSGSAANVLSPLASPMLRNDSRLSGGIGGNSSAGEERRESSHFRRTASASSREHRSGGAFSGGGENLLRPAEELGGRSSAFGTRNVPIHRG